MVRYRALTKYKDEIPVVLQLLEEHPEGLSLHELYKITGWMPQNIWKLLNQMYLYGDDVYVTGFIMHCKYRKKIDIIHRYCLTKDHECEAYQSFKNRKDIIKIIEYDYENRSNDFELRYRKEKKYIAKALIDKREGLLKIMSERKIMTEEEVIQIYDLWAKYILNTLIHYKRIAKYGNIYKIIE